jgi:putative iron-regulated protein
MDVWSPLLCLLTCMPGLPAARLAPAALSGQGQDSGSGASALAIEELERQVVQGYAGWVHQRYALCRSQAQLLSGAVERFLRDPSAEGLERAREAWCQARRVYGQTEVLRFYGGPIDDPQSGVEAYLNAWPVDESYLDGFPVQPEIGLVNQPERLPVIAAGALELLNQLGGETNIAIGWHAIEYLLWGVDQNPAGPGQRSYRDFLEGAAPNAARRGAVLRALLDLLVQHLMQVEQAWLPEGENYRARFVQQSPKASLRSILAGMVILSGFELAGERLAVAYETQDQEQEHSCFSDTTLLDLEANQLGIMALWSAEPVDENGQSVPGVGLSRLGTAIDPILAAEIDRQLSTTLAAVRAIPAPFDQAIQGPDDGPGRRAVLAALVAFEQQTRLLGMLALAAGHRIQISPGG